MRAMMIEAALRALLLAAFVGLGLRSLRVSNVPARKAAWSGVLLASMAMPLLMRWPAAVGLHRLGWAVPVPLMPLAVPRAAANPPGDPVVVVPKEPVLRWARVPSSAPAEERVAMNAAAAQESPAQPAQAAKRERNVPAPGSKRLAPGQLLVMIYCGIGGALLLRLLWGLAVAVRLWMGAEMVSPLIAPEPNVRSSRKINSPVTIGSGIVLPADYVGWDRRKLRMVLAHERAHVRGLDFYLQLLAGLYTAIFWFSPLGWLLRRTLSTLGEAMGDRAGLHAAASRSEYAQIVLEFAALPRRSLPGVAMARSGNLSRRVESMLNDGLWRRAFAEGRRRAMLALLLIPAALFGVTALIRVPAAQAAQTAPQTAPAVTPPDAAAAKPPAGKPAGAPTAPDAPQAAPSPAPAPDVEPPAALPAPPSEVTLSPAQAAPTAPSALAGAPEAPAKPAAVTLVHEHNIVSIEGSDKAPVLMVQDGVRANGYRYGFSDDGESWAIVQGPKEKGVRFSGNWNDDVNAQIDKARSLTSGPFLWFTHDGKSYIIDDAATVARISALYKPMEALGRQQEALGRQQEAFGKQQEELGRLQEQASARVPDLSAQVAEVNAALATLQAEKGKMLTQQQLAEVQEKVAQIEGKLGELQGEAGAKQGELGAQQGKLGEEQGKLGAQQGQLGEQQGRLAKEANRQVRSIIDESLRNGTAKPLN